MVQRDNFLFFLRMERNWTLTHTQFLVVKNQEVEQGADLETKRNEIFRKTRLVEVLNYLKKKRVLFVARCENSEQIYA